MKIALISDIHSNICALDSVYADLEKEQVNKILVIGDLIGYYYWPKEVVAKLIDDERVICIRGNHEEILGEILNSGVAAAHYKGKYGSGYEECISQLSDREIEWLITLPKSLDIDVSGISFHLCHGALGSVDKYIYPDAEVSILEQNYSNKVFTVFGHTHYPFIHSIGDQYLLNPGSVGQPRDVGGMASYAIVNLENKVVRFKRVTFDIKPLVETARIKDPELKYLWQIMSR